MKLPARLTKWLLDRLFMSTCVKRKPDVVIGGLDHPYLYRWHVIRRNPLFNIYFHRFMRSDDDRALHDHPWWNFSLLLEGQYSEHRIDKGGVHVKQTLRAGDLKFRGAKAAHRVELIDGQCWTLFVTGPRIREWGFHCVNGWRHWKDFTEPGNKGRIGKGCD